MSSPNRKLVSNPITSSPNKSGPRRPGRRWPAGLIKQKGVSLAQAGHQRCRHCCCRRRCRHEQSSHRAPLNSPSTPRAPPIRGPLSGCAHKRQRIIGDLIAISVVASLIASASPMVRAYKSTSHRGSDRMVRLCIASVDPIKLTSQCVMCNRREFPLTVIDCTGITKVNDLIASPLSVQEATCLIYNCRRQVPDVKPEPYHGSVSSAVNYRGAASNYHSASTGVPPGPWQPNMYEMMPPSGMFGGGYSVYPPAGIQTQQSTGPSSSPYMTRFGSNFAASTPYQASYPPFAPSTTRGLMGNPSAGLDRQQALPYALVPAPRTFPFGKWIHQKRPYDSSRPLLANNNQPAPTDKTGSRKYKAALVPLFR